MTYYVAGGMLNPTHLQSKLVLIGFLLVNV